MIRENDPTLKILNKYLHWTNCGAGHRPIELKWAGKIRVVRHSVYATICVCVCSYVNDWLIEWASGQNRSKGNKKIERKTTIITLIIAICALYIIYGTFRYICTSEKEETKMKKCTRKNKKTWKSRFPRRSTKIGACVCDELAEIGLKKQNNGHFEWNNQQTKKVRTHDRPWWRWWWRTGRWKRRLCLSCTRQSDFLFEWKEFGSQKGRKGWQ